MGASQSDVTVNVTLAVPPHANGAPVLLLVITEAQPPLKLAVASQFENFVFIADCVWQAASVTLAGQFKTTAGASVTVNVRTHDFGDSQSEVTVKVTLAVPPQASGAPVLLLVNTPLQPPVKDIVDSQSLNFMFMVD